MDQLPSSQPTDPDSVDHGFGIGCLAIVGGALGYLLIGSLVFGSIQSARSAPLQVLLLVLMLLPLAAPVLLALRMRRQDRRKSAKGVLAAILIALALVVLLAAACFGLLSFY